MTIFKILLCYYGILNGSLLIMMGLDKRRAIKRAWRIPETNLFALAFLGGGIGGFIGMFLFRHKKNKPLFYVMFAISIILHGAAIYFIKTNFIK